MDWATATVNIVSILLAFAALVLLWREVRRGNVVMLDLIQIQHSYHEQLGVNHEQMFHQLTIWVKNEGVALHDLSVVLSFGRSDGRGSFKAPFDSQSGEAKLPGEFSRGMVAKFSMKSFELDQFGRHMLSDLKDLKAQNAKLNFFSQGYIARSIPVARWSDRSIAYWNKLAFKFNGYFDRDIATSTPGPALVKRGEYLRIGSILSQEVARFTDAVRKADIE